MRRTHLISVTALAVTSLAAFVVFRHQTVETSPSAFQETKVVNPPEKADSGTPSAASYQQAARELMVERSQFGTAQSEGDPGPEDVGLEHRSQEEQTEALALNPDRIQKLDEYKQRWERQSPDLAWTRAAQASLAEILAEDELAEVQVAAVDCRESLCRVEMDIKSNGEWDSLRINMAGLEREGSSVSRYDAKTHRATVFIDHEATAPKPM